MDPIVQQLELAMVTRDSSGVGSRLTPSQLSHSTVKAFVVKKRMAGIEVNLQDFVPM